MTARPFVHATALIVGEAGILIEGPSGSGKSTLAMALLADAARAGRFGCLVGDDRVSLGPAGGRLIARPHPATAGWIEQRGMGLLAIPHEVACVLALAVQLRGRGEAPASRLPETAPTVMRCGIVLPLLVFPASGGAADRANAVWLALARSRGSLPFNLSNLLANSAAMHKIAPHGEAGEDGAEPH